MHLPWSIARVSAHMLLSKPILSKKENTKRKRKLHACTLSISLTSPRIDVNKTWIRPYLVKLPAYLLAPFFTAGAWFYRTKLAATVLGNTNKTHHHHLSSPNLAPSLTIEIPPEFLLHTFHLNTTFRRFD